MHTDTDTHTHILMHAHACEHTHTYAFGMREHAQFLGTLTLIFLSLASFLLSATKFIFFKIWSKRGTTQEGKKNKANLWLW